MERPSFTTKTPLSKLDKFQPILITTEYWNIKFFDHKDHWHWQGNIIAPLMHLGIGLEKTGTYNLFLTGVDLRLHSATVSDMETHQ